MGKDVDQDRLILTESSNNANYATLEDTVKASDEWNQVWNSLPKINEDEIRMLSGPIKGNELYHHFP